MSWTMTIFNDIERLIRQKLCTFEDGRWFIDVDKFEEWYTTTSPDVSSPVIEWMHEHDFVSRSVLEQP